MAGTKAEYNGHTGVWVTSRGRRIFIRDGESITDSILRYNKEKGIKTTRQDIQASKYEYDKNKKHESFLNSPAEDLEEKEYNRLAKDYRDSFDLENEYNKLYENPNYYDEMQGTDRLKAKAMAQPIEDYNPRHEEGYIESQKLQKAMAEGKISSDDWNNAIDNNNTDKINSMLSDNNISNNPIQSMTSKLDDEEKGNKNAKDEFRKFRKENYDKLNVESDDYTNSLNKYLNDNGELGGVQGGFFVFNADEDEFYGAALEHDKQYIANGIDKTDDFETGNYNPMEEFSDAEGNGLSDLQNKVLDNLQEFEVGSLKSMAKEYMQPEEIDSHEGDLYLKKTPVSEKLINKMKDKDSGLLSTFKDQQTGETWYDIPFANMQDDFDNQIGEVNTISSSESDKIQKFQENLDKGIYKDNKKAIEDFAGNDDELKEKLSNDAEIGFVQEDSMYGGVIREYTNKELREMAERGIRPRKDSYGHPGAWEGINRDKGLSKKEIAKTVQDAMKKKYPNTKLTRSTSGYADVEITISSSSEPITVSNDDIDKMEFSQFGNLPTSHGFDRWAKENVEGYSERPMYDINDVRNYAKTILQDEFKGTRVSGDEWYLTDYGKNLVNDIQKELNSYNYDDSNGMVDYFNRGFYDDIQIGKWNKPYENTSYNKSTLTNKNDDVSAKVERFKKRKGKK